mmetsp:Transcript_28018/g.28301  ORF Transcript_28018/g.28301 Transcript_28018/m.28301 type:complete len:124 (+) Transcript_28018:278-649(+)
MYLQMMMMTMIKFQKSIKRYALQVHQRRRKDQKRRRNLVMKKKQKKMKKQPMRVKAKKKRKGKKRGEKKKFASDDHYELKLNQRKLLDMSPTSFFMFSQLKDEMAESSKQKMMLNAMMIMKRL